MELHLGMDEELTELARIKGTAGAGDSIMGICYELPDQKS